MDPTNTLRDTPNLGLPRAEDPGKVVTIPNILTAIRILLTPVFLLLIFSESWYCKILALLVFTIASLTDFFDGRIARRHKTISSLGRFMDPLADKLLVSSALISFVILGMVEACWLLQCWCGIW